MWSITGCLILVYTIGRHFWAPRRAFEIQVRTKSSEGGVRRLGSALAVTTRHYLLPDSLRMVFGRTSRLQVLILGILFAYVCIFSFVGIGYQQWTTPASAIYLKESPGLTQKRSWLGPWSDRIGTFAYALTPFSVLLASRESILSLLTGIPYQSFNFLHRWLGWIILIQSIGHTLGWVIIEGSASTTTSHLLQSANARFSYFLSASASSRDNVDQAGIHGLGLRCNYLDLHHVHARYSVGDQGNRL